MPPTEDTEPDNASMFESVLAEEPEHIQSAFDRKLDAIGSIDLFAAVQLDLFAIRSSRSTITFE